MFTRVPLAVALATATWSQRTIADRQTQLGIDVLSNSGNWDMIASNETGPNAGRYLFMPFETGLAGVQRVDTQDPNYNTRTMTIVAPGTDTFVSGDGSGWAPWGGYLGRDHECQRRPARRRVRGAAGPHDRRSRLGRRQRRHEPRLHAEPRDD